MSDKEKRTHHMQVNKIYNCMIRVYDITTLLDQDCAAHNM